MHEYTQATVLHKAEHHSDREQTPTQGQGLIQQWLGVTSNLVEILHENKNTVPITENGHYIIYRDLG
jgi:hypothetical protein